jgi:hypothetical protein
MRSDYATIPERFCSGYQLCAKDPSPSPSTYTPSLTEGYIGDVDLFWLEHSVVWHGTESVLCVVVVGGVVML